MLDRRATCTNPIRWARSGLRASYHRIQIGQRAAHHAASFQIQRSGIQPQPVLQIERLQRRVERLCSGIDQYQLSHAGQVVLAVSKQLVEVALAQATSTGDAGCLPSVVTQILRVASVPIGASVSLRKVLLELCQFADAERRGAVALKLRGEILCVAGRSNPS